MKLACILTLLIVAFGARAQVIREHVVIANPRVGIVYWPTNDKESSQITREQVVELLQQTNPEEAKDGSFVQAFRFAPLTPNKMYLLAAVDLNGRYFYEEVFVMYCDGKSCTQDGLYSRQEIDLAKQIISIADNSLMQIVTEEAVGVERVGGVSMYHVYEMAKDGPVEVSSKYRDWYKDHILPELEAQRKQALDPQFVDTGQNALRSQQEQIAISSAQAQYAFDEYRERVLGIKDALMSHALEWAKSSQFEVRQLASRAVRNAADSKVAEEVLQLLETANSTILDDSARQVMQEQDRFVRKEREERRSTKIEDKN